MSEGENRVIPSSLFEKFIVLLNPELALKCADYRGQAGRLGAVGQHGASLRLIGVMMSFF